MAARTVAPIRSDSFLAGMTTARSPRGDMGVILAALRRCHLPLRRC